MNVIFRNLPDELKGGLAEVAPYLRYSVAGAPDAIPVTVSHREAGFSVSVSGDGLAIAYGAKSDFFRALTFLPRVWETGSTREQTMSADTLSYMADVSRNGVLHEAGVHKLLIQLALLGYNSLMLYTEETYEVPGEPYFGYARGRYSLDELRALDDYADLFGIELIPCIQTLAHLASALRWPRFDKIKDTDEILLAGCDETYTLIEKMVAGLAGAVRSRRIHIGMDEAHSLGLGKYLDQNGYRDRFSILSDHLIRVRDICLKYGKTPLIWSDMFFRLYCHGEYWLAPDERLPREILDKIPAGVSLVYWDYYNTDPHQLDAMFESHIASGNETWFAGGATKWVGFAPFNRISMIGSKEELLACRRHGVRNIILTAWGDDGAEASPFSILPTMAYYAESVYRDELTPEEQAARFEAVFGLPLASFMKLDLPNEIFPAENTRCWNPSKYLLYQNVLGGLLDAHVPADAPEKYAAHAASLAEEASHPVWGYLFRTEAELCEVLSLKTEIALVLRRAYRDGDREALRRIADEALPTLARKVRGFLGTLKKQWLRDQKSFGFDILLERFSAMIGACEYAAEMLDGYLAGELPTVDVLDGELLPYEADENGNPLPMLCVNRYEKIFSASKFTP